MFFLAHSSDLEPSDHMTTAAGLAKAVSVTLSPFLEKLTRDELHENRSSRKTDSQ